jgi:hypothetical protein
METGNDALEDGSLVFKSAGNFLKCLRYDIFWFSDADKQSGALYIVLLTVFPGAFLVCWLIGGQEAVMMFLGAILGIAFGLPLILLVFLLFAGAIGFIIGSGGK